MTTKTLSHNEIFQAIEEDSKSEQMLENFNANNQEPEFFIECKKHWDDTETSDGIIEWSHYYVILVHPYTDEDTNFGKIYRGWINTEKALHETIKELKQEDVNVHVYGIDGCIEWMQRQLPKAA